MTSSIHYRPEIDGLRAVAVLPVILFHLGLPWLPGGFAGVDVFFVISGYLITSIISHDCGQGQFTLRRFWGRRIRRIVPALLCMLVVCSIIGSVVLYALEIDQLGKQGAAALLSFANVYLWLQAGDYWGAKAESAPFLHTWSLSVEEQFYLFFPLLFQLAHRYCRRHLVLLTGGLTALSAGLFLYGCRYHPGSTFYLLPARAWELGSGCLLALLTLQHPRFAEGRPVPALLGLGLIGASFFLMHGESGISPWLIGCVAGTVLVIACTGGKSTVTRCLAAPPLVLIGKMSYSLYLWHWPVILLARNAWSDGRAMVPPLLVPALIALAGALSWHFIERPTRYREKLLVPLSIMAVAALGWFNWLSTIQRDEDVSGYSRTVWDGQLYNNAPGAAWRAAARENTQFRSIDIPSRDAGAPDVFAHGGVIRQYGAPAPQVVVLGDSHALMWSGVLDEICAELALSVSFSAADGNEVFFEIPVRRTNGAFYFDADQLFQFEQSRLNHLSQWKPRLVIISARWSYALGDKAGLAALVDYAGGLGSEVLFIGEPPALIFANKNVPQYLAHMELWPAQGVQQFVGSRDMERHRRAEDFLRNFLQPRPFCKLLPTRDLYLNQEQKICVLDGAHVLYIDDNHLSHQGARRAKDQLREAVSGYFPRTANH